MPRIGSPDSRSGPAGILELADECSALRILDTLYDGFDDGEVVHGLDIISHQERVDTLQHRVQRRFLRQAKLNGQGFPSGIEIVITMYSCHSALPGSTHSQVGRTHPEKNLHSCNPLWRDSIEGLHLITLTTQW
jgi:hypothetical protein